MRANDGFFIASTIEAISAVTMLCVDETHTYFPEVWSFQLLDSDKKCGIKPVVLHRPAT